MIWLRHELWEYNDGLGYRLASRTDGDETGAGHRDGVLKHVFYAPSPAAAKAQYWALRQLGPIIPSRFESDEPFTLAQLQAQLAQFPDDATLHAQPALHPDHDAYTPLPAAPAAPLAAPLAASEGEPLESLEPWPVVAHSEPERTSDGAETPPAAVAAAEPDVVEAADETAPDAEPERPSNVVPIRPDVVKAAPRAEPEEEPQSAEAVALERPPAAASGALALALAELGPAAAASGALALALAELEPTPHTRPDDARTGAGSGALALVASHSTSSVEETPTAAPTVGGAEVAGGVAMSQTADAVSAEPVATGPALLASEAAEAKAVELPAAGSQISEPPVVEPLSPEPLAVGAEVAEPLVPEPVAAEKAVEPDPLGPITAVAAAGSRGKRRKTGFFGVMFRLLILAIVAGAIIVGVGIATGRLDAPTLLAQARALPDQARQLAVDAPAFVRGLLPS